MGRQVGLADLPQRVECDDRDGNRGKMRNAGGAARGLNKYRAALGGLTGTFWIVGLFSAAINLLMLTGSV